MTNTELDTLLERLESNLSAQNNTVTYSPVETIPTPDKATQARERKLDDKLRTIRFKRIRTNYANNGGRF